MEIIRLRVEPHAKLSQLEYNLKELGKQLTSAGISLDTLETRMNEQLRSWKEERTKYTHATTTIYQVPAVRMLIVLDRPNGNHLFTFQSVCY